MLGRRALRTLLPAAGLLTLLAGGAFAALEADTVDNYWEGLFWALSLMTTVGFAGDTPDTVAGKTLAGLLMVLGFVLLALTTAAVASLFVREDELPAERAELAADRELLVELRRVNERLDSLERRIGSDET
jgi:voltage-gated potassium channel